MMSSKKGVYGSKQEIKCGYCDETSRKDNLQRHIDTKHPGEPFKFSYITCKTGGIKKFFDVPVSVSEENLSGPGVQKVTANEEEITCGEANAGSSYTDKINDGLESIIPDVSGHQKSDIPDNLKRKNDGLLDQNNKKTNIILE